MGDNEDSTSTKSSTASLLSFLLVAFPVFPGVQLQLDLLEHNFESSTGEIEVFDLPRADELDRINNHAAGIGFEEQMARKRQTSVGVATSQTSSQALPVLTAAEGQDRYQLRQEMDHSETATLTGSADDAAAAPGDADSDAGDDSDDEEDSPDSPEAPEALEAPEAADSPEAPEAQADAAASSPSELQCLALKTNSQTNSQTNSELTPQGRKLAKFLRSHGRTLRDLFTEQTMWGKRSMRIQTLSLRITLLSLTMSTTSIVTVKSLSLTPDLPGSFQGRGMR